MSFNTELNPNIKLGHGHTGISASSWLQRSKKDESTCYGKPSERSKVAKANMEKARPKYVKSQTSWTQVCSPNLKIPRSE